jgi:Tol biopolymer transport system component
MTLVERAGREQRVIAGRAPWTPRFSPDGRRVAYGAFAPGHDESDVWIADLGAGTTQRVTTDGKDNNDPQWSPDGQSLAYSGVDEVTSKDVLVQPLDGREARRATRRSGIEWPSDWSRDGRALLFTQVTLAGEVDLWVQPLDGGAARSYLATPAREAGARLSSDGRWVAYTSDETGRFEVHVQSYPAPGRKTLVSAGGGGNPVRRGDGRELYYWQGDQLLAATLGGGSAGEPRGVRGRASLFRAPYILNSHPNYDASPDGTRFVLVTGRALTNYLVLELDVLGAAAGRNGGRR